MKSFFRSIVFLCVSFSLFRCNEKMTDTPLANQRPKTYLWLYPDTSGIGIGISRQHLHWWGEDPDGIVRGFLFAFVPYKTTNVPTPDTLKYTWLTANDTIIRFPLDTLFRYFTVFVRAVDNTFPGLTNQTGVRLSPSAHVEVTGEQLPALSGAMDPVGSVQAFPIRNTPPTISFSANPNDPANALRLPDTTYTVVSIGFKGSDSDGDNTLSSYRIALNDTTNPANWLTVGLRDTMVTLVVPRTRSDSASSTPGTSITADVYNGRIFGGRLIGQLRGLLLNATNVIYVQAKDVAAEYSPAIRIPSGTQRWYVKRPRGRLLLVGDYTRNDLTAAISTYVSSLNAVPDPQFAIIDQLNMAAGVNAVDKQAGKVSVNVPPFVDPALVRTFLLYDYVFLFTDEFPTVSVMQSVPFLYLQNGGKLLLSTIFSQDFSRFNATSVLREFAPIDSVCSAFLPAASPVPGARLILANTPVWPDSSVPSDIYPQLAFNATPSSHVFYMRELYKRTDARVIYRLQASPGSYRSVDPSGRADTVRPKVAVVDGQGKIVYSGLPLHLLNNTTAGIPQGNPQGLTSFFTKIFAQHFSPYQRIDRRRF